MVRILSGTALDDTQKIVVRAYFVLVKYYGAFRIEAYCQQNRHHLPTGSTESLWILRQRKSMPSDYRENKSVVRLGVSLKFDPIQECTQEVA